jgi:hypothetical protein
VEKTDNKQVNKIKYVPHQVEVLWKTIHHGEEISSANLRGLNLK